MVRHVKKAINKYIITERKIDIIACLLIILVVAPYMWKFKMPQLNTDEFGYWGSASFFAGYDWSEVISTNSYFSYGYGLILAILLLNIKNSIICFKAAIVLNAVFLIGLYLILKRIACSLFDGISHVYCCVICLIATLYCATVCYAGMSLPECLLAFLFALNIYLLLLFIKKISWSRGVLIFIFSFYMYIVHMRTIVFLAMNILIVVAFLLKNSNGKIKKTIIKIGTLLVIVCLLYFGTNFIKTLVQSHAWKISSNEVVGNDFSGQVSRIKYFLSKEGITDFIYNFCGRIFYFITSTYGFIMLFISNAVRSLNDKNESAAIKFFNLYLLLSIIGTIAISCIFSMKPTSTTVLFYGRYCDNIMPVVVLAIGLSLGKISKKNVVVCIFAINILGIILSNRILKVSIPFKNISVSHVAISKYYVNGKLEILAIALLMVLFLGVGAVFVLKNKKIGVVIFATIYLLNSIHTGYQAIDTFYTDEILDNIELTIEIAYEIKSRNIEELTVLVTDNDTPGKYDKYGKIIQFVNPRLMINLNAKIPNKGEYYIAHKGKGPKYGTTTVLAENEGYTLGIYE